MSIFTVLLVILVVGVLLWLAETYVPMNATVKRILIAVTIIALVLWILNAYHLLTVLQNAGRIR